MVTYFSGVYIALVIGEFCHFCNATENLALGKTTEQSSTYVEYNATKAVDGYDSQKLSDCAHTGIYPKQNVAWWQVDIGEISEIKNIKIYYRDEGTIRRFDGFQLYSGENKQWMDKDQCYRDTEDGYSPSVVTVNCPGLAQYITIVNGAYDEEDREYGPILELCEVQVFGCSKGFYGIQCNKRCSSFCYNSRCDTDTGRCLKGCNVGYYGSGCKILCSRFCYNFKCDEASGECLEGCNRGFYGKRCEKPCSTSCVNSKCDINTGHCLDELLSLNKPATQSSTYLNFAAKLAVDGNLKQEYPHCSHTGISKKQPMAWWQLDLLSLSNITSIKIYQRRSTSRRLNGFHVYISNTDRWFSEDPCYRNKKNVNLSRIEIFHCTGLARFITIVNYNYSKEDILYGPILELCEVQVFGITTSLKIMAFVIGSVSVAGGVVLIVIMSVIIRSWLRSRNRSDGRRKQKARREATTNTLSRKFQDDDSN